MCAFHARHVFVFTLCPCVISLAALKIDKLNEITFVWPERPVRV